MNKNIMFFGLDTPFCVKIKEELKSQNAEFEISEIEDLENIEEFKNSIVLSFEKNEKNSIVICDDIFNKNTDIDALTKRARRMFFGLINILDAVKDIETDQKIDIIVTGCNEANKDFASNYIYGGIENAIRKLNLKNINAYMLNVNVEEQSIPINYGKIMFDRNKDVIANNCVDDIINKIIKEIDQITKNDEKSITVIKNI